MSVSPASQRPSRWWTAALTAIAVMMAGTSVVRATDVPPPPPPAPDCGNTGAANSHAARAYSLSLAASLLGIDIGIPPVPDTGELPSGGGDKDATLVTIDGVNLPIPLPDAVSLKAKILHNTVFGSGNTSTAYSAVTDLDLAIRNKLTNTTLLAVSADVLTAQSTVKCISKTRTVDTSRTGSKIAKLAIKVMGVPIVIPLQAPANTKIALPKELALLAKGGIVLNEQVTSNGRQVVNAVHVKLEILGVLNAAKIDLVISHAEANTVCGTGTDPDSCTCKARDFVTGGGQIPVDGGTASFAVNGRSPDSHGPKGRVNLVDHTNRRHIKGDDLNDYQVEGDTARSLSYTCTDNWGGTFACTAFTQDDGTSGGGIDQFGLSPDYPTRTILHGNIVLHKPNCGTGGGGTGGGGNGGGGKGGGGKGGGKPR